MVWRGEFQANAIFWSLNPEKIRRESLLYEGKIISSGAERVMAKDKGNIQGRRPQD